MTIPGHRIIRLCCNRSFAAPQRPAKVAAALICHTETGHGLNTIRLESKRGLEPHNSILRLADMQQQRSERVAYRWFAANKLAGQ